MSVQPNAQTPKSLATLISEYENAKANLEAKDYSNEAVQAVKTAKAAVDKFHTDKKNNVDNIRKTIDSFGFTLTDIYTDKEITKAGYNKAPVDAGNANGADSSKNEERPSKSNFVLIHIKGAGVGDPGYKLKKGRIYEPASKTNKKPFTKLPEQLEAIAGSLDTLKAKVADNAEAKAYIATEEGKKELQAIVDFAKELKAKATATAPKK